MLATENKLDVSAAIFGYLFAERGKSVYAILDGASVEKLLDHLYRYEPEFECLYRGDLAPDIAEVAPYLVRLEKKSAFTDWVVREGWGNHWGIFAVARVDLPAMRRHLRRFLTVHDSSGTPMLFRYYDPRVLRTYLPTCNSEELGTFFGPVLQYIVEGDQPSDLLRCEFMNGELKQHVKQLQKEQH